MASKSNLKVGIKYSLTFHKKKLFGIFVGEHDGLYYFVEPDSISEYGKSKLSADILIDKKDNDVLIKRVSNKSLEKKECNDKKKCSIRDFFNKN
jgi:hypothetical protein